MPTNVPWGTLLLLDIYMVKILSTRNLKRAHAPVITPQFILGQLTLGKLTYGLLSLHLCHLKGITWDMVILKMSKSQVFDTCLGSKKMFRLLRHLNVCTWLQLPNFLELKYNIRQKNWPSSINLFSHSKKKKWFWQIKTSLHGRQRQPDLAV
jgi:hypothetical protein